MPQAKKHSAEEIIPKLRAAKLEIAKGRTAAEAAKKIGVAESPPSWNCVDRRGRSPVNKFTAIAIVGRRIVLRFR
jgi:hypothetical protein